MGWALRFSGGGKRGKIGRIRPLDLLRYFCLCTTEKYKPKYCFLCFYHFSLFSLLIVNSHHSFPSFGPSNSASVLSAHNVFSLETALEGTANEAESQGRRGEEPEGLCHSKAKWAWQVSIHTERSRDFAQWEFSRAG